MWRNPTGPTARADTAELEAAAWHTRLGDRKVSSETIEAFFAWRAAPENAEAYQRIEKVWADAGKLSADPEIAAELAAAMNSNSDAAQSSTLPKTLMGLAAIGAAVVLGLSVWAWQQSRTVYATGVGEQRLVQLADGSSIRLDTGSRIRVRFEQDQRLVDLEQGQALFTVAKDADRPFVVDAGGARVTAVGTVFDVRREGAAVSVTLVSGVVDVKPASDRAEARRMTAGQQTRVSGEALEIRGADVQVATGWTQGRIVFRDTPLREAVAEVNRYLSEKIELDAQAPGSVPVTGVFRTGDRDAFVSTASELLDLEATPGPGGTVRLAPEQK
jgi:transmembrane sensor